MGACVLLAWSPYSLLDPGFQLSFAAVAAIFLGVPRLVALLPGLPVPRVLLGVVVAVSIACSLATAPILWLHFEAVPVLSVVANALAAPVVGPILGLGLGAAAVGPLLPGVGVALSWLAGCLAAYLAGCARLIGGLPFAQVESGLVLVAIATGACGMLACWRWPRLRRPAGAGVLAALARSRFPSGSGWAPQPLPPRRASG